MKGPERLTLNVVPGIPLITSGADLGSIIIAAIDRASLQPRPGDVVVVTHKVVSKAQGRFVDLTTIIPSARARDLAILVDKDPRFVEVILSESVRIVRSDPRALIVEHREGYVAANAGVDRSNVDSGPARDVVLLLPNQPDAVAESLRKEMEAHFKTTLGVIVSDSFGRPWRHGTVGVALGSAGIPALNDLRGQPDLFGYPLEISRTALADEVASAASLLMGQADESHPVVLVSGLAIAERTIPARALIRSASEDLFR